MFIDLLNNPGLMPGPSQQLAIENFPAEVQKHGWFLYDGTKPHGFVVGIATYSTYELKLLDELADKNLNLALFNIASYQSADEVPYEDIKSTPFVEYYDGENFIRYEGHSAMQFLMNLPKSDSNVKNWIHVG